MSTETNTAGPGEVSPGRAAYEAYALVSDGKSLVSGAPLPAWDEQRPEIREAWRAAAGAAAWLAGLRVERERDELRSLLAMVLDMAEGTLNGETFIRRGEIAGWRERAGIAS
jgi:hypothetical protein